jgi:hypothetical protein
MKERISNHCKSIACRSAGCFPIAVLCEVSSRDAVDQTSDTKGVKKLYSPSDNLPTRLLFGPEQLKGG